MTTIKNSCPSCGSNNVIQTIDEVDRLLMLSGSGFCKDCLLKMPVEKWNTAHEIKEIESKQNFFSGLAVVLQVIVAYDQATIAEEIILSLGNEKEEFYQYLKEQGGVDEDTRQYLLNNNI